MTLPKNMTVFKGGLDETAKAAEAINTFEMIPAQFHALLEAIQSNREIFRGGLMIPLVENVLLLYISPGNTAPRIQLWDRNGKRRLTKNAAELILVQSALLTGGLEKLTEAVQYTGRPVSYTGADLMIRITPGQEEAMITFSERR